MPDQPYADCCDFCARAESTPEESACSRSTARCVAAGDSCDRCKQCFTFRPDSSFRPASQLLRSRPETPKTDIVATVAAPKQSRIRWTDRPAGKVGP